jgi:hypothetical protein
MHYYFTNCVLVLTNHEPTKFSCHFVHIGKTTDLFMVGIWSVFECLFVPFQFPLGMVCFMGDVNNFAANNMVSLDEIKEINLLARE